MVPHRYIKLNKREQTRHRLGQPQVNPRVFLLAKGLMIAGAVVIGSVFWPIFSYELFTAPSLKPQQFISPIPAHSQTEDQVKSDLLNPEDWFPQAQSQKARESKITHYTLSIAKFNIIDAIVSVYGKDLSKNLIQYEGSAFPGELGATIIFGHSILPQFFSPKNYMAIFSLIPTMEFGDEIIIKFDGMSFIYRVIDKTEVKPDNLAVLEQSFESETLRLITCTPPGTYLRRAVITAALIKT